MKPNLHWSLSLARRLRSYTNEVTITNDIFGTVLGETAPGFHQLSRKTIFTYASHFLLCRACQPLGAGLDVFKGRPKLSAWRDRVRAAIGAELFDESHQGILSAQEMAQNMDGSKLQHFKPKILKMFL